MRRRGTEVTATVSEWRAAQGRVGRMNQSHVGFSIWSALDWADRVGGKEGSDEMAVEMDSTECAKIALRYLKGETSEDIYGPPYVIA